MSTKTTPKKDFATKKAEAVAAIEDMHGRLASGILTEEDWTKRLSFMSRLHNYSPRNSLLMWAQWEARKEAVNVARVLEVLFYGAPITPPLPELTYPAAYSTWQGLAGPETPRDAKGEAMPIAKGEKALSVLAPFTVTDRDKDPDPVTGKYPVKVIGFVLKSRTFDISQTVGIEAPPSPIKLLEGEGPEQVWDALVKLLESMDYTLELVPSVGTSSTCNGRVTWNTRVVEIKSVNDRKQQIKTLVHEVAHILLHEPEILPTGMPQEVKEIEAESVAYAVLNLIGVDSSDYTLGYVAHWSGGNGALVASTLERVAMTATRVVTFLETGELPDAKSAAKFDFLETEKDGALVA